jgi:accessory gene regulator protein AgrB
LIFNIFIETLIITISFTIFRLLLKGEHLHSFNKCTILSSSLLLSSSYIAKILIPESLNMLLKVVIYCIIGFGLELFAIGKVFKKVLIKIDNI